MAFFRQERLLSPVCAFLPPHLVPEDEKNKGHILLATQRPPLTIAVCRALLGLANFGAGGSSDEKRSKPLDREEVGAFSSSSSSDHLLSRIRSMRYLFA
jgi:hypothetical protein